MGAALRRKHGGAHALTPGRHTPDGGGCAVAHVPGAMHEGIGTTNGVWSRARAMWGVQLSPRGERNVR